MADHTKGPITASQYLDDGRYGLLTQENEILVGVSAGLTEADAIRLASCWNACEGLTQDHFDGDWTAKGLSQYAKKLEGQVADLRAALQAQQGDALDAARYRYLRDPDPQPERELDVCDDIHHVIDGWELDAAIDAAMLAARREG